MPAQSLSMINDAQSLSMTNDARDSHAGKSVCLFFVSALTYLFLRFPAVVTFNGARATNLPLAVMDELGM
jgi:hypothetical protein